MSDEQEPVYGAPGDCSEPIAVDGAFSIRRNTLAWWLSRAGLALVPAADVVTPEERALLKLIDEARRARSAYLLEHPHDDFRFGKPRQFVLAELMQELMEWKPE